MTDTLTPTEVDRDTFLGFLRASGVLTEKQIDRAIHAAPAFARSSRDFADYLFRADLLTRFQVERLLSGRTDGFHIGAYLVLDYLGKSATGRVYKARHRTMNRLVAIKVLATEQTATEEIRAGIRAEARQAARLAHTNIVTLLDANQAGERMYFVKEFLDGGSLDALVKANGPLPIRRACEFVRQAALGLQHAHEKGVAHGRLSPTAILVGRACGKIKDEKPLVKVSGFGLGRLGADHEEPDFEYRAPEQFDRPELADAPADLYSLGCVFFFALAGRPPFPAARADEAAYYHRTHCPQPLNDLRSDVPTPLVNFVHLLLNKSPDARPISAEDVSRFLQPYADADESHGSIDFTFPCGPASGGMASHIQNSLPGILADLPHEPIIWDDDDFTPAATMVLPSVTLLEFVPSAAEQPTVRSRSADTTPLAMPKRRTKPVPEPRPRNKSSAKRYAPPKGVNPLALGAVGLSVCVGVLFAVLCLLKIYDLAK